VKDELVNKCKISFAKLVRKMQSKEYGLSLEKSFVGSLSLSSFPGHHKLQYLQHQTSFGSCYDELSVVQCVQSFRTPCLDHFAMFLKALIVDEIFSTLMLIATSANPQLMNLAIWSVFNELFNGILKWIFQEPRPTFIYGKIIWTSQKALEPNYSFPSGHAQTFAYIAFSIVFNDGLTWYSSIFIILWICGATSRLYLGVHFLHDILIGCIIGLTFAIFQHYCNLLTWWISAITIIQLASTITLFIGVPSVFLFVSYLFPSRKEWTEWSQRCVLLNKTVFNEHGIPSNVRSFTKYSIQYGLLLGAAIGSLLLQELDAKAAVFFLETFVWNDLLSIWPRILAATIGCLLILGIVVTIRGYENDLGMIWTSALMSAISACVNIWITLAIPLLSAKYSWNCAEMNLQQ